MSETRASFVPSIDHTSHNRALYLNVYTLNIDIIRSNKHGVFAQINCVMYHMCARNISRQRDAIKPNGSAVQINRSFEGFGAKKRKKFLPCAL